MAHNGDLANFISDSSSDTIVRHVSLDTEYAHPTKGLMGVLKLVDHHWDLLSETSPEHLSVVEHSWGLAPLPEGQKPSNMFTNADLVPDGLMLVAEVKVIRPADGLTKKDDKKVEDIFVKYFKKRKSGKPFLFDLHPAQCVRRKNSGPAIFVDIEPRLMVRR